MQAFRRKRDCFFAASGSLPDIEPIGLIQHHALVLGAVYRVDVRKRARLPVHRQLTGLSRVVISVEQRRGNPYLASAQMALAPAVRRAERLRSLRSDPLPGLCLALHVWRTLHADDFGSVTSAQFRTTRVPWKAMHFCGAGDPQVRLRDAIRASTRRVLT